MNQNINPFIAIGMVFAFGVGASYIILDFANATDALLLASSGGLV